MKKLLFPLLLLLPVLLSAQDLSESQKSQLQSMIDKLDALDHFKCESTIISSDLFGMFQSQGHLYYEQQDEAHKVNLEFVEELPYTMMDMKELHAVCTQFDLEHKWCEDLEDKPYESLDSLLDPDLYLQMVKDINAVHAFRGSQIVVYNGEKFIRHNLEKQQSYVDNFPEDLLSRTHLAVRNLLQATVADEPMAQLVDHYTLPNRYAVVFNSQAPTFYLNGDSSSAKAFSRIEVQFDAETSLPRSMRLLNKNHISIVLWDDYDFDRKLPENHWSIDRFSEHEVFESMRDDRETIAYPERGETKVLWGPNTMRQADPDDFRQLGESEYYVDGTSVYFQNSLIDEAHAGSFEIKDGYCVDSLSVFVHGQKVRKANAPTYKKLNTQYAKDASHVFFKNGIVDGADPKTFSLLGKHDKYDLHGYAKDRNRVYAAGKPVEGIDPATFEVLAWEVGKDATKIVLGKEVMDIWHAPSFERLSERFVKDKDGVYFISGKKIDGLDPESISIVSKDFLKDKNAVYDRKGKALEGLDPASFEHISKQLCKDKNGVYNLKGVKIEKFDAASFVVLNHHYTKDKNMVYYDHSPVRGADPATFEVNEDDRQGITGRDKDGAFRKWDRVQK